jgi:orotidine-5'-phosphate decarboxylase
VDDPRDRLIVALDVASVEDARAAIAAIGDAANFYKIGYELAYAGGLALAEQLADNGIKVFIDLKLHDIPNTVAAGIRSLRGLGASFITVHAYPTTMRAAVEARGDSAVKILGVTVLTSFSDQTLADAGYGLPLPALMEKRIADARAAGVDGVICSPTDLPIVKRVAPSGLLAVTPGIRPAGADAGDQARIATPAMAIAAGADHLVVGRPIMQAADRRAAAFAVQAEIAAALAQRSAVPAG